MLSFEFRVLNSNLRSARYQGSSLCTKVYNSPLNGGRDKGFEELCSQLARAEVAGHGRFIRKGNPDAGVECYAINDNGSEYAWQAKYFLTLGDNQWSQIDRSVCTALGKHPRLMRYVICLPMDLPDARVPGQESALAKWGARVEKWAGWASERGMTVEFMYWGSSELLERLTKPEHVGRVRFWFDANGFDADWFTRRLEEARQTAGPRYTPEVHVELPIASRFAAFGRTDHFFDRTIGVIRGLANEWASACSPRAFASRQGGRLGGRGQGGLRRLSLPIEQGVDRRTDRRDRCRRKRDGGPTDRDTAFR